MRSFRRMRWRIAALSITLVGGCAAGIVAVSTSAPDAHATSNLLGETTTAPTTFAPVSVTTATTSTTIAASTSTSIAVATPARVFATGNAQLDALLATLPPVLFEADAHVHYGYNPIDCCHAGGYNPYPNDVWVSERAFTSAARLRYVTVHELAHSIHLETARGAALTTAVAGAPSVRPGSQWDVSEKVADCVVWALYPSDAAASGITYWTCPDPWRSQVRAALQ
jgi:hypothetical protein